MVYQRPGHLRIDRSRGSAKTGGSGSCLSNGVFMFSRQCYSSCFSVLHLTVWNTDFFRRKNRIAFLFILWVFSHIPRMLVLLSPLSFQYTTYDFLHGCSKYHLVYPCAITGGSGWGWMAGYFVTGTQAQVHGGVICCTVSNVVVFYLSGSSFHPSR